jgi:hypothetical protein
MGRACSTNGEKRKAHLSHANLRYVIILKPRDTLTFTCP